MRLQHLCTTLLVAGLAGGTGCIIDAGPDLRLTRLEVTGENDFGLLDLEVHLFDADTHEHLGCSGQDQGLEDADEDNVMYGLDAWFVRPYSDGELRPWMLGGRTLEIQVIEDDADRCPAPPGAMDDMIGISGPVDRDTFERAPMLSFDRVMAIQIQID
ncbi:MAG TPA: hypothetical protein VHE35_07125 [Kofleriaceae bacterium]|nr:hypothetical protein [Kofleriaceae bacterium]